MFSYPDPAHRRATLGSYYSHMSQWGMSVRGVWVLLKPKAGGRSDNPRRILFSRRYPTVERRAKLLVAPSLFCPLPPDSEICEAVLLNCSEPTEEFSEERDSCSRAFQKPVFELLGGRLWPVVCIEQNGLLFVAAPLVECAGEKRPPIIELPGVSAALTLLEGMSQVLGADGKELDEGGPVFLELFQYLCLVAPFGSPTNTSPASISLQLKARGNPPPPKLKQPSWRPAVYRGNSRLQLTIKEEMQAAQYDKPEVADDWQVYGTVQAKVELEGHPDVLLTLATPPVTPPIDHLVLHSCVQSADAEPTDGTDSRNRKIRFSAPLESFTLCHYLASQVSFLPVRGFYQMKGDHTVKLLIQLKLNEIVKNNFEYFEVHMPFFNRGPIDRVDSIVPVTASTALSLSQDRKTIVWDIGQRFPSKSLEMSLQATVHFPEHPSPAEGSCCHEGVEDGPYFVGLSSYIELIFKIPDYTISNCNIDARSVTLFPSTKYKLIINRELGCSKYRIWNSHGKALATFSQLKTP